MTTYRKLYKNLISCNSNKMEQKKSERRMQTRVYLTTDSNEVKGILSRLVNQPHEETVRINGRDFLIKDISMRFGEYIKNSLGLRFKPMSRVSGKMTIEDAYDLLRRMSVENIHTTISNGQDVSQSYLLAEL